MLSNLDSRTERDPAGVSAALDLSTTGSPALEKGRKDWTLQIQPTICSKSVFAKSNNKKKRRKKRKDKKSTLNYLQSSLVSKPCFQTSSTLHLLYLFKSAHLVWSVKASTSEHINHSFWKSPFSFCYADSGALQRTGGAYWLLVVSHQRALKLPNT